jgi:DNA ligase (NAD+)
VSMFIEEEISELREKLNHHSRAYYVLDEPEITDGEYDALFRRLQKIEAEHPDLISLDSPTQRAGGETLKELPIAMHSVPMLSIDNAMSHDDAVKFDATNMAELGVEQVDYCAEPKYDGLSLDLRYENGILVRAATRGNGTEAEEVTAQARTIKTIPLRLKKALTINVRGEAMMTKANFLAVNAELERQGKKKLANCRNGAAGAVRQLDPKKTAGRKLSFFAYGVIGDHDCERQSEVLQYLRELGFVVSDDAQVVKGMDGVESFYQAIGEKRSGMEFDIDGTVFKVDRFDQQEQLGWRHRVPAWAIAYKFPAEEMPTILKAINIQIGRTGKATPVAELESVFVGGVNVTSATLHNIDRVTEKNVMVGDTVIVRRAGDVIPEIVGPILERRPDGAVAFSMPSHCPVCASPLQREDGSSDYVCSGGMKCEAQRLCKMTHFGSRLCMDIEGLGESTVESLINANLANLPSDFYALKTEDVQRLEGFGEQSARNLISAIESSIGAPLNRFIFSLGIEGVGEKTAKDLASSFGTWEALFEASEERLLSINGVGPATSESIVEFMSDPVTGMEAIRLANTIKPKEAPKVGTTFEGKTFVLTGSLPTLTRESATALIEGAGGKVSGSVSKKTFAVVSGDASGSKLDKAKALQIQVWGEDELRKALGV